MLLRDIELAASRKENRPLIAKDFECQVRSVAALMQRCIDKCDLGDNTWRIRVEVVKALDPDRSLYGQGVVTIQVLGSVSDFLKLPREQKKPRALVWLMEGISRAAENRGWDIKPFQKAAEKVRRLQFINRYAWKKPRANKDRTLKAEIIIAHEIEYAILELVVRDFSGGVIYQGPIYQGPPTEFDFSPQLGELKWCEDTVVLFPKHWNEDKINADYKWRPICVKIDRDIRKGILLSNNDPTSSNSPPN